MADVYASCAACAFWFRGAGRQTECRRYPPQVVGFDEGPEMLWPETTADDWCGEFKRRDSDAVKPLTTT